MNFLENFKVDKVAATQSDAASNYTGATVLDMLGYETVAFMASFGTAANDNGIKVQQSDASGSGFNDLAGTQLLSDGTQKQVVSEVYRPTKRYVKVIVIRGTSSTIEAVWAARGGSKKRPETNTDTNQASEITISPAEGTA